MDVSQRRKRSAESTVAFSAAGGPRQRTETRPSGCGSCPNPASETLGPTPTLTSTSHPRLTLDIFNLLDQWEPLLPAVDPSEEDVKLSGPSHTDCLAHATLLAGKQIPERDARHLMALRNVVTGRFQSTPSVPKLLPGPTREGSKKVGCL